MVGEIRQVPPMVSAVRVGGERLYRAARRGEEVERPARAVTVHALDVARFDATAWEATLEVRCSSGTYVRTLAADIGERLGCGAHVTALRRSAVGSLAEADAVTVAQLEGMEPDARRAAILPMRAALRDYESLTVSGDELRAVGHGRSLGDPDPGEPEGRPVAVLDPDGHLLAVYRRQGMGFRPAVVLA